MQRRNRTRISPTELLVVLGGILLIATAVYANARSDAATERLRVWDTQLHAFGERLALAHAGLVDERSGSRTMLSEARQDNLDRALSVCTDLLNDPDETRAPGVEPDLSRTRAQLALVCDDLEVVAHLMARLLAGDTHLQQDYDMALALLLRDAEHLRELLADEIRAEQTFLGRLLGARVVFITLIFAGLAMVLRRRDREQARLALLHRRVLESTADGILGIDRAGTVRFANPAAGSLLGVEVSRLAGRGVHETACDTSHTADECALRVGGSGEPEVATLVRSDGTEFAAERSVAHLDDDAAALVSVMVFRDVSERRRIERLRSQFVSMVSHELRTPLTAIHGALGLLRGGRAGDLPERAHRMVDIAHTSTERLVRLINDILDLEKLDQGRLELRLREAGLDEIVERALAAVTPPSTMHLDVVVEPLTVRVDVDRVEQLVVNLVGNAVKFSPPTSRIEVRSVRRDAGVELRVTDEGRGVPEDQHERIFERFAQVDSSDARELGGTGLGLAISRQIAEQHGGHLWVESVAGQGSTFILRLPADCVVDPADVAPAPRSVALPEVLVVAQDESSLDATTAVLDDAGFVVLGARDPAGTIEIARSHDPDAIVVQVDLRDDVSLPIADALRATPELRGIPLVLLAVTPEATDEGPADPGSEVVNLATLVTALTQALGLRRRSVLLLVEDDPELAALMQEVLEASEIDVAHATDGDAAIAWCADNRPDVISLDIGLPGRDGHAVVAWLRQHDDLRSLPLVVYSAADLSEEDRRSLRLGETSFLTKGRVPVEEFRVHVIDLIAGITGRDEPS